MILDIVGGEYLRRNLQCLASNGRLVQIGLIGGARAELDLAASCSGASPSPVHAAVAFGGREVGHCA